MSSLGLRTWGLTALAMVAFASNSLLCRAALRGAEIDPASFTALRLVAGALVLSPIALSRRAGSWLASVPSALALFGYAAAFSIAYLRLNAGVGALILFGMVQVSMIGIGRLQGQRLHARQVQGGGVALLGLIVLTLPLGVSLASPPLGAAAMMAAAGIAWGIYSVRGRTSGDPVASTARNFLLSVPFVFAWWWTRNTATHLTLYGALLAVTSGALTSGLGYVIWYRALRSLLPVEAALVQLSVPVLTALAGVWLMGEPLTVRLAISATLILTGIALAVLRR